MQKVSIMRRNSSYQNFIDICLFLGILLVYDAFSSMYLFLPPLFGILFLSFVKLYEKERYYSLCVFVITICIMEANKGFCPTSLLSIYCIMYLFLHNKIIKMFKYVNVFEIIYIPVVYLVLIILNSFINISDENILSLTLLLWYIFIEILMMVGIWILNIK